MYPEPEQCSQLVPFYCKHAYVRGSIPMTETRIVFFPAHGVIVEAQHNFRSPIS
jgi:hypothetical protein